MELNGFVAEREEYVRHINMVGSMAEGLVILSAGALAACGGKVCVVDHSFFSGLYAQASISATENSTGVELGGVSYYGPLDNMEISSGVVIHYYDVVREGSGIDTTVPTYLIVDNDMHLPMHDDVVYDCELNLVMRDDLGDESLYSGIMGTINCKCNMLGQIYRLPLCREDKVCEVRAKRYADYAVKRLSEEYRRYLKGLCADAGIGELDFSRFKKFRVENVS